MRRLACAALVSVGAALTAPRPRLARRGVSVRAEVTSPAAGVAAVLAEVWSQLTLNAEVDEDVTILFPNAFLDETQRSLLPALYEHLECCKDVSDRFGTRVVAVPSPPGSATAVTLRRIGGASRVDDWADDDDFEVSPELLAKIAALSASDENDDYYASGGDDDEDEVAPLPERPPASDVEVLELSRAWVDAIVSGAGVCPFSVDAGRAGLPVGNVRYEVSRADSAEAAYAAYWREVDIIDQSDERSLSTTLLILADERWTRNYEEFETFGGTLAQALQSCDEGGASGLGFEDEFQLVFFHPNHVFRDGRDRSGKDGAANFARRSPWPMINILRTNQVKAAQKGLPTALVYAQNEATLADLGMPLLQEMLDKRDWTAMGDRKIDRKNVDVLRTAQALMRESSGDVPVPAAAACPAAAPRPAAPAATSVWTAHFDEANGVTYYYNAETQQSQWEVPVELA